MRPNYENNLFQEYLNPEKNRSFYLRAYPGQAESMDLFMVFNHVMPTIKDFLIRLLEEELFRMETKVLFRSNDKLPELYATSRYFQQFLGFHSLGFGYPLYLAPEAGSSNNLITAPLFVWQLELQPKSQQLARWTLLRSKSHHCFINRYFLQYLKEDKQLYFTRRFEQVLEGSKRLHELQRLVQELASALQIAPVRLKNLKALPTLKASREIPERGALLSSGIFSNFPLQRLLLPDGPSTFPVNGNNRFSEFFTHPFGLLTGDPDQDLVLKNYQKEKLLVFDGPTGTGKTHTITNIVTNALSNGRKCLVMAAHRSLLEQLHQRMAKLSLEPLCLLVTDPFQLRTEIVKAVTRRLKAKYRITKDQLDRYKNHLASSNLARLEWETQIEYLKPNRFGSYDWSTLTGLFLARHRQEQRAILAGQLEESDFNFTVVEFQILQDDVRICQPLFEEIRTLKHPLQSLDHDIFLKELLPEARKKLESNIDKFYSQFTRLKYRYILKLADYKKKLTQYYTELAMEFQQRLEKISAEVDQYLQNHGRGFGKAKGSLKLLSIFSEKYRTIRDAKGYIDRRYRQLEKDINETGLFRLEFLPAERSSDMLQLKKNLDQLEKSLKKWVKGLEEILEPKIKALNSKSALPQLDFKNQIENLEYSQKLLIEELNAARVWNAPVDNRAASLREGQQLLENVLEELEDLRLNMRDFDIFYSWQWNWLRMPRRSQKVILGLIRRKPSNWLAAFESWYLDRVLSQLQPPYGRPDYQDGFHYAKQLEQLRTLMIPQIFSLWTNPEPRAILKQLRKQKAGSFQSYLEEHFEQLTSWFPVIFCTPELASLCFPLQGKQFDLLIVDEAQLATRAQVLPLGRIASQLIITGNSRERTLPVGSSVFEDQVLVNSKHYYTLAYQHLRRPGYVFRFYHLAFDRPFVFFTGGREILDPPSKVLALNGTFDESTHTNEAEAIQLVEWVLEAPKTPEHRWPIIAVICWQREQQQLVARRLLHIGQGKDLEADKVRQLYEAGLGVYHIDDLATLSPELVIGSIGYQSIPDTALNTARISLLSNGNYKQLLLCHSLSREQIYKWQNQPEKKAYFLLGHFLEYAAQPQAPGRAAVLEKMKKHSGYQDRSKGKSIFYSEVALAIEPFFEPGRITIEPVIAYVSFPLAIRPKYPDQPPLVIQVDATEAIEWESMLGELIAYLGLDSLRIWSIDWWREPELAARKLASEIIKWDRIYASG